MGIFDSYKLTPKDHIPNNLDKPADYIAPPQLKRPLVLYNKFDEPIGLTWNYGDSVGLSFTTTGFVIPDDEGTTSITAEQYLEDKTFKIYFLDWRYNIVASYEAPAATQLDISTKSFDISKLVRGNYYLTLELVDADSNVITTLIKNCSVYIQ